MNDIFGYIGSILLAFCGAPEAYRAVTAENYDISLLFILMWGIGEACLIIPIVREIKKPYLVFNYSANLLFILVILGRIVLNSVKGG